MASVRHSYSNIFGLYVSFSNINQCVAMPPQRVCESLALFAGHQLVGFQLDFFAGLQALIKEMAPV